MAKELYNCGGDCFSEEVYEADMICELEDDGDPNEYEFDAEDYDDWVAYERACAWENLVIDLGYMFPGPFKVTRSGRTETVKIKIKDFLEKFEYWECRNKPVRWLFRMATVTLQDDNTVLIEWGHWDSEKITIGPLKTGK